MGESDLKKKIDASALITKVILCKITNHWDLINLYIENMCLDTNAIYNNLNIINFQNIQTSVEKRLQHPFLIKQTVLCF